MAAPPEPIQTRHHHSRSHKGALLPILSLCLVVGPIGLMAYILLWTVIGKQRTQSTV